MRAAPTRRNPLVPVWLLGIAVAASIALGGPAGTARADATEPPAGPTATATTGPTAGPPVITCRIGYAVGGQWPGGFQGEIRISNTGATPITAWTLRWSFPDGQRISVLWYGSFTQLGPDVAVSHAPWGSMIPPGGSVGLGFLGSWTGANGPPRSFTLNGLPCAPG
jgi:endo-1,4-beta-xylanase